jgi:hypothetical protein
MTCDEIYWSSKFILFLHHERDNKYVLRNALQLNLKINTSVTSDINIRYAPLTRHRNPFL